MLAEPPEIAARKKLLRLEAELHRATLSAELARLRESAGFLAKGGRPASEYAWLDQLFGGSPAANLLSAWLPVGMSVFQLSRKIWKLLTAKRAPRRPKSDST